MTIFFILRSPPAWRQYLIERYQKVLKKNKRIFRKKGESSLMPCSPGAILKGEYRVVRVLGEGGMARVYEVQELRTNRRYAMKEMMDHFKNAEERNTALVQFRGEAVLLLKLSHPNIPKVMDFFSEGSSHFMVMQFIEGADLDKLLKTRGAPFPQETVTRWAVDICRVLYYLHIQRPPVVFRDIKPSNIILTSEGTLVLLDFGIARIFKAHKSSDTFAMGTEGYAAPEQYLGGGQTDPRSDLYALGATLYHLSLGEVPLFSFPRTNELPMEFAAIIRKATQLDPDYRYQNAREMKNALMRMLHLAPPEEAIAGGGPGIIGKKGDRTSYMGQSSHQKETTKICERCGAVVRARSRFCCRCGDKM
jgi:serine/threonine protein kinase